MSSQILVVFVTSEPWQEVPYLFLLTGILQIIVFSGYAKGVDHVGLHWLLILFCIVYRECVKRFGFW